ncbi:hypothetical protein HYS91_03160 [Candidatus Daviesbacteria bacterium]|nr:hypothetical protein [Candidatus Daviesbacteria bacterium]
MERFEVKFTPRIGNIPVSLPETQSQALERVFQDPLLVAESSGVLSRILRTIEPVDVSGSSFELGVEQFKTSAMKRLAQARRIRRRRKEDPVLYVTRDEDSGETVKFSDAQREVIHYWLANFDRLPLNSEIEQPATLEPSLNLSSWVRSHLTDERIGYHLGKLIARSTPIDLKPKVYSTIESMGGTPLILPNQQKSQLGIHFSDHALEDASEKIQSAVIEIQDPDSRLGNRFLDPTLFRSQLAKKLNRKRHLYKAQKDVIDQWLEDFENTSPDQPTLGKAWGFAVEDRLGNLGSLSKLLMLSVGLGLRNLGDRSNIRGISKVGEKIIAMPANLQVMSDSNQIGEFAFSEKNRKKLIKEVTARYDLDELKARNLQHPDFYRRVAKSLGLSFTIYTLPRYVLGYAALYGLLNSPEFRSIVDSNPAPLVAAATTSALACGMGARAVIDSNILKKRQYNPDIWETPLANMTGKIDENGLLAANPSWGKFGAAFDIFVSGFTPMFAWGWYIDEPYSRYAYGLACYVDQVVFATTNVAWATTSAILEKNKSNKQNE